MTWLLVYKNQRDPVKGKELVDFLRWSYETGYQTAASLDYAPLPEKLRQRLIARLGMISLGSA
jgi:phosphate transport system substrate-binding protein